MTKTRAAGGGRKPLTAEEPTVKVAITLLSSQVEAMKQLGDGNLSAGIRKAIEMNEQQARKLAIETIAHADAEGQPVADTTVVGFTNGRYWVTDNGEEVINLTKEQAIEIIVENLTAE